MAQLTGNALQRMLRNENVQNPILQITGLERSDGDGFSSNLYRVTLNDGIHMTSSAYLSSPLATAAARKFFVNSVIKVKDYKCKEIQNCQAIRLLVVRLLRSGAKVQEKIGSPTSLELLSVEGDSFGQGTAFCNQRKRRNDTPMQDSAPAKKVVRSVSVTQKQAQNGMNIVALVSLRPGQKNWCVRVRITRKYPMKPYDNGKLFNVELADESGEMKAVAFKKECDRYYKFLKEGSMYYIENGYINEANRKWTSIKNDYEMVFNRKTQIAPIFGGNIVEVPMVTFNFVTLDMLPLVQDRLIDVIGVIETVGILQTVTSRTTNEPLKLRVVRLVDDSMTNVSLALWEEVAEGFEPEGHPVVAFKGVRVTEFNNGIELKPVRRLQIHMNPDIPEARRLRSWYDASGHLNPMKRLSNDYDGVYLPLAVAEADQLGSNDDADYFSVKGFISSIKKENCLYQACVICNRKVFCLYQGKGPYFCEKCNTETDAVEWRMLLRIKITDFSTARDVLFFNESAEQLIGMSAQHLADLKQKSQEDFDAAIDKLQFKQYLFRLKASTDVFGGKKRIEFQCIRVQDLNTVEYCKYLQREIKKMESMADSMQVPC